MLLFLGTGLLWGISQSRELSGSREPGWCGRFPESGEFAFFHVQKLASLGFQGRAPGTKGGNRAAQYLASWFQRLGLKPGGEGGTFFQTVKGPHFELVRQENRWKPNNSRQMTVKSDNVLGFIGHPETSPGTSTIIISAHYDHLGKWNTKFFPGANDNASGLGVLLEAARVLKSRNFNPKHQILFAAWTFEEEGLYGSAYFASTFPPGKVRAAINLDSLGSGEAQDFLIWTHQANNPLLPLIEKVGEGLGLNLQFRVLPLQTRYTSDHQPFAERGIPAVTILSPNWLEKNHTFQDVPDQINTEKLEKATKLVIKVVEELASQDPEELAF